MFRKKIFIVFVGIVLLLSGCSESDGYSTSTVGDTEEIAVKKAPIIEVAPSNWYIRVVAEDISRALKTESAQLGELESNNATEKHTLKALAPFGGAYLDVVFTNPDGVDAGEYKVNFHTYQEYVEDRWAFTVKTDDVNETITLYWRGLYVLDPYQDEQGRERYKEYRSMTNPLLKHMKLVDTATGTEYPAVVGGIVQKYSFELINSKAREFEWVVTVDEVNIPKPVASRSASRIVLTKEEIVERKVDVTQRRAEQFDLSKPPMFIEQK